MTPATNLNIELTGHSQRLEYRVSANDFFLKRKRHTRQSLQHTKKLGKKGETKWQVKKSELNLCLTTQKC